MAFHLENYIARYPKDGDNTIITKIGKKDWELYYEMKQIGRIRINEEHTLKAYRDQQVKYMTMYDDG